MTTRIIATLALAATLGGCANGNPLQTGSLFGGATKTAAAAPQAQNDPVSRAFQVGSTAARAQKCGFNFDAVKLRTQFIAAETATNPADAAKVTQIYDTAYRGVTRAVADKNEDYCTGGKVAAIKSALNRHMTGDYSPEPPAPVAEEDGGLFGSAGSSSSSPSGGIWQATKLPQDL